MIVRWTGLGWLGLLPVVPAFAGSLWLLSLVDASMEARVALFGPIFVGLSVLVTAPLGWLLNSTRTPQGRVWHDRHTLYNLPLQYVGAVYAIPALILVSLGLGRGWHPIAGWVFFAISAVAVMTLIIWLTGRSDRRRRQAAGPVSPLPNVPPTFTGPVIGGELRSRR
ncbi:hypothetical protein Vqi01_14350 [Micromonospora qiuiae]|uniref:Uncharacterized protein n=2 Tax=Micromonospora qiuiae TaxID=502268 RepID=A0ABQ4J7X9_9ACTN|nr:hypothetical protein Vqi01_14350 [Micromonospora qiuiae]